MAPSRTFTGQRRSRETRWRVQWLDRVSRAVITVGGIGTIVAVLLVFVFLVVVSLPLFLPAELQRGETISAPWGNDETVRVELDEYQTLGWTLSRNGELSVFHPISAETLKSERLFDEQAPATLAVFADGVVAAGFQDGTVQLDVLKFDSRFLDDLTDGAEFAGLPIGESRKHETGIVQRTEQGQLRHQVVIREPGVPLEIGDQPIVGLDYLPTGNGGLLASIDRAGQLQVTEVRRVENLATGEMVTRVEGKYAVDYRTAEQQSPPDFLKLIGRGDNLCLAWRDGTVRRFDLRNLEKPVAAESLKLFSDEAQLTLFSTILGRATLIAGDSRGRLQGMFVTKTTSESADGADVQSLVLAKSYPTGPAGCVTFRASPRNRLFTVGFADGSFAIYHATSEQRVANDRMEADGAPVRQVFLAPREDAVYGLAGSQWTRWNFDARHPEASFWALFGKVWYEGYSQPEHVWQATGGSIEFEPKLGLVPLVFGSLKATFYSMLFGAPIALLAAVYTSEFLDRGTRARVKPGIEMMASLPSVVLGFLAALVFAPLVREIVPALMAAVLVVPSFIILAAYLWQLLPESFTLRARNWRWIVIGAALIASGLLSLACGPWVERRLFGGDLIRWLDGPRADSLYNSPWGGWLVLLLPVGGLTAALLAARFANPVMIIRFGACRRSTFAMLEVAKFAIGLIAAVVVAAGLATLLTAMGLDPRGPILGTYVQRNAMIVGVVMGFAIIPIIYTIADDALAAVPESLRSASLGAGATPWQTAVRIVIPTAMSGLFSALMVGLGRAVGETMIVLMAGGNTPVLEWNPFNGFRTLSATLAVELADAVRDTTHYRTLFFAGLTLFVLTFCVNTLAEVVRLRFRRRVYQL